MYQNYDAVGRTIDNIKIRYLSDGTPVANFILAVQRKKNKEIADFIPCVAWGELAKLLVNHVGKGSLILVNGELRSSKFKDEETGRTEYRLQLEAQDVRWLLLKNTGSGEESEE
ncbi:MAG TPA: single-stranded DNA-binding protein [Metabacillus sp.]|nr:single-stranded DNA-binding protein [Metabacillus sp.]